MKKNLKNLWGKRIFSSFLSISFLLSGIFPAFNVSAASPASVPDTLTLKESAGVCSGNSVAFNVRSNAFNSSKLKFYQDMLSGSHKKTNASTKSGAPNATSAEDWFNIAYILHRNRQSQSGTSNYSSRMEAMRYSTIAEYNNTGKISNNEYKGGYVWHIHRNGFNYSNSLSNANTDIRKKLYEYYLAQHTSGSHKKGWNSSDKSATNSFKSLEDNTNQDVFWSILSLNRSEGDNRRRGHGSALIAVFYDFKVSPVLQEDTGTTYIRTRSDGSDKNESFVSSFTNDTPQSANAEYTGSTENTVSHTSNISGSSSYTMGHSVTVGTSVNFGAFASGSVDYTFDYSNTVEKGWSKEDSVSKTEKKEDKSSISLPAYSVNLKTINITYDGLISTRALSRIETADNTNHKNLPAGTSMNVSDIKLKGINAAGTDYIGFNQNRGHWILTDATGHEDTSGKIATLTTDRTGKVSLNATAPGTIYLEYVIDENCYATASKPDIFTTNDKLASTAVIKIHVEKCESHHYKNIRTEATPSQDGSIIKRCSICNDSQLVQTIAKPDVYTITKNTYNGKVLKPSVTITDRNGKKLSPSSYEIIYKKTGKNVGTYQAQINFRGDYTGSKTISYQILPKNCSLRSVKAKKKSFTVRWKKLSTKMPTKRISGYQIQYSEKPNFSKSKIKKVSGYKKTSVTIKKLKSKKKYYVRIRTILKSGGKTYYSNWSGSKGVKAK